MEIMSEKIIVQAIQKMIEEEVKLASVKVIEEAKYNLEIEIKKSLANVAIGVMKNYTVFTRGDEIVITVQNRT